MRRVVVTGMGIVSSIGNNCAEVFAPRPQYRCFDCRQGCSERSGSGGVRCAA